MGTTADKLNKILESKAVIKAAIEAKGVSDVGDVLADYPDKIASISGGGSGKFAVTDGLKFSYSSAFDATQFDTSQVTDMSNMFHYYKGTSLDLSSWDTSNVTDMSFMFSSASSLNALNISGWNTSKVTTMDNMFYGSKMDELNISSLNTSNVTNMNSMFYNCTNLTTIDLSNFDTSKVTTMKELFYNCNNLISSDLSNFDTSKLTSIGYLFYSCFKLQSCDMSTWDLTNVSNINYMFNGCSALIDLKLNDLGHNEVTSSLSLNSSSKLSKDSVLFLFNNAFDRKTAGYTKAFTITLNAATKALLTDDEIAIATNKGFTVV